MICSFKQCYFSVSRNPTIPTPRYILALSNPPSPLNCPRWSPQRAEAHGRAQHHGSFWSAARYREATQQRGQEEEHHTSEICGWVFQSGSQRLSLLCGVSMRTGTASFYVITFPLPPFEFFVRCGGSGWKGFVVMHANHVKVMFMWKQTLSNLDLTIALPYN